eukprot:gene36142-46991_t
MADFIDFRSVSLAVFIISAGLSSIGVSTWQYSVVDNGITFENSSGSTESLSTICSTFPYEYLRPFSVAYSSDMSDNAYCGYGTSNTAFRLALAIATVIFGVLMATPVLKGSPNLTSFTLFFISILWYSATVADSTAFINGTEACNDGWGTISGVTCNGANYGITVALDVMVSIIILIAWLLNGGLGIFGITTQNNPPSERNATQNNPPSTTQDNPQNNPLRESKA